MTIRPHTHLTTINSTRVQKLPKRRAIQCIAQFGGRRQPRVAKVARLREIVQIIALFGERGAEQLGLDRLEKVRLLRETGVVVEWS